MGIWAIALMKLLIITKIRQCKRMARTIMIISHGAIEKNMKTKRFIGRVQTGN